MGIIETLARYFNSIELDREQEINNKLYEENGLTDEVLDNQIKINKKRNALDILDETELTESNEGFVQ